MNQRQEVTCWNKGNQENGTCGGGKSSKHLEGSCGPVQNAIVGRGLTVFVVDELADSPPVEVLEELGCDPAKVHLSEAETCRTLPWFWGTGP